MTPYHGITAISRKAIKTTIDSGYYLANGVNFKLFNSSKDDLSEETPVVRQSMSDGGFYLLDNQTARFTFQFLVKSGLKIAQTGDNMLFTRTSGKVGSDVINTANPSANTASTANGQATTTDSNGYTRYSSTWSMKDGKDATVTSDRQTYNTYLYSNQYTPSGTLSSAFNNATYYDVGAMPFDYFLATADANEDVVVTVTYDQTVLTGDLMVKKVLPQSAKNAITNYQGNGHTDYNPEFAFRLYFSKVFGYGNATEKEYISSVTSNAIYYLTNGTNYLTSSDTDGTHTTANLSDAVRMVDSTAGAVLNYKQIDAGYYIVVKDIPVDTHYSIEEVLPTPSGDEPEFTLKSVVAFQTANSDSNTNSTHAALESNSLKTSTDLKLSAFISESNRVPENTGVLSTYYLASTGAANYRVEATNDATKGYIIIAKQIDHLYYNTNGTYDDSDAPAKLFGHSITVAGKPPTDDDKNGYQAATNAEQTFIFKIDEYASDGNGGYVANPVTFYETLSFGANDKPINNQYPKKYRILAADTSCKYVITEITDWSWKYSASDLSITPTPAADGNVKTGNNQATIVVFNTTNGITIPVIDANGSMYAADGTTRLTESGSSTKTYKNSALAEFTNSKITRPGRDVEGDTSIVENTVPAA